ncbi:MAG TPA: PDZ domain-containing protein [Acidimicrobiia bacterium]
MSSTELMTHSLAAEPPVRRKGVPRWLIVLVGGLIALAVVAVAAWSVSLPYFAFAPGPTRDVESLITVDGAPIEEADSELYMLTVSVGNQPVNIYEYVAALLDPDIDLVKSDLVRPPEVSYEEYRERNENLMDESVNLAIYVALRHLGYDATFTGDGMVVVETVEGTPGDGALQKDDVIVEIDGEPVALASDGVAIIQSHRPGDTVVLTVRRGDGLISVPVTLVEHSEEPGAAMVGVLPDTLNLHYEFPIDVRIDSSAAIGPSAGLAYSLGVVNALTPEVDELNGYVVAATGTINEDGEVGAIGGVRQKVLAAEMAGAEIVLVPAANYQEAVTAGAEVRLVPVGTLEDALAFLGELPPA